MSGLPRPTTEPKGIDFVPLCAPEARFQGHERPMNSAHRSVRGLNCSFRRPTLYPAELRALALVANATIVASRAGSAAGRRRGRALAPGRSGGGSDGLREPSDEGAGGAKLGADSLVAGGLVQPRLEGVATGDGELATAQMVDARVVPSDSRGERASAPARPAPARRGGPWPSRARNLGTCGRRPWRRGSARAGPVRADAAPRRRAVRRGRARSRSRRRRRSRWLPRAAP